MWAVKCVGCKDLLAPNATSIVYHYRSTWNRDDINFIACPVFIVAAQVTASRARIEAHLGHTFPSAPFIWDVTSMVGVWLASFHYAGHCWLIRISWWTKMVCHPETALGLFGPTGSSPIDFALAESGPFFLFGRHDYKEWSNLHPMSCADTPWASKSMTCVFVCQWVNAILYRWFPIVVCCFYPLVWRCVILTVQWPRHS